MGQKRAGCFPGASSGKLKPQCLLWAAQSAAEAGLESRNYNRQPLAVRVHRGSYNGQLLLFVSSSPHKQTLQTPSITVLVEKQVIIEIVIEKQVTIEIMIEKQIIFQWV